MRKKENEMIKVFTVNGNGKIEFTKAELEKLLNDTYAEGQKNCKCNNTLTWTPSYINTTPNSGTVLYNDSRENSNANTEHNSTNPTITIKQLSEQDRKRINEEITKLVNGVGSLKANKIDDVFNGLIKELDF
jgi:hypothetical protein